MQHGEGVTWSVYTAHARIDPWLRQRLEALAKRNDRSLAGEVRQALRQHVEREQETAADPRDAATSRPSRPHAPTGLNPSIYAKSGATALVTT
jgi:TraY domain